MMLPEVVNFLEAVRHRKQYDKLPHARWSVAVSVYLEEQEDKTFALMEAALKKIEDTRGND